MSNVPKSSAAKRGDKTVKKQVVNKHPFIESKPKNFAIGRDVLPKKDLSRIVRWPAQVRIQRQRKILLERLKVPPPIYQFRAALNSTQAKPLFALLKKYRPERPAEKKARLRAEAEKKVTEAQESTQVKPLMLKFGLKHVTDLIESKLAKLVLIAHDVEPIELVLWLPALCRKKEIPYCIVKSKARLGKLVGQKTCAVVAVDRVRKDDQPLLDQLCKNFLAQFNENAELRRRWGGGQFGIKSVHTQTKKRKAIELEQMKKAGAI